MDHWPWYIGLLWLFLWGSGPLSPLCHNFQCWFCDQLCYSGQIWGVGPFDVPWTSLQMFWRIPLYIPHHTPPCHICTYRWLHSFSWEDLCPWEPSGGFWWYYLLWSILALHIFGMFSWDFFMQYIWQMVNMTDLIFSWLCYNLNWVIQHMSDVVSHNCSIISFLFLQLCLNFSVYLSCNNDQFICSFLTLGWLLQWLLYQVVCLLFLVFWLTHSFSNNWSVLIICCSYSFTGVTGSWSTLHKLGFHLSDKNVALDLDNSTAKVYLYNQGGTASFKTSLTFWILAVKHSITLTQNSTPTYLNVEADIFARGNYYQNSIFFLTQIKQLLDFECSHRFMLGSLL